MRVLLCRQLRRPAEPRLEHPSPGGERSPRTWGLRRNLRSWLLLRDTGETILIPEGQKVSFGVKHYILYDFESDKSLAMNVATIDRSIACFIVAAFSVLASDVHGMGVIGCTNE
jgi:hypothetical protein